MLENCDRIMHLRFNIDACPKHSPFRFMHLTHQNLSAHALFCHNSLAKVKTQFLIYKYKHTEFWCVQCPRPAGPSALDKHQIQASALDLSYFTSKRKCKFINLIHTRQKNKIICSLSWKINVNGFKISLNMKNINNFTQWKKMDQSMWRSRAWSRTKSTSRSLGAVRGVQWTFSIHSTYSIKSQSENKKLSWSVWI